MQRTKGTRSILIGVVVFVGYLLPAQPQSQPFETLCYSTGEIRTLAFSPNNQLLAFSRQQGFEPWGHVQIWDLKKKASMRTIQVHAIVETLRFSPNNELLAVGCWPGGLQLWNLRTGKLLHALRGAQLTSFSQDNKSVVSLSINAYPGAVEILQWDVTSGMLRKKVRIPLKPNHFSSNFALSRDGKLLAMSVDHTIIRSSHYGQQLGSEMRLYDARTGKLKRVWRKVKPKSAVTAVEFSPNARLIATGDLNGRLILRDARSNAVQRIIFTGKQTVHQIIFSPDGKRLASMADGKIQIWNYQTGALSQTLMMRQSNYNSVAFSPDNKVLAGVDAENFRGRVNLWRIN